MLFLCIRQPRSLAQNLDCVFFHLKTEADPQNWCGSASVRMTCLMLFSKALLLLIIFTTRAGFRIAIAGAPYNNMLQRTIFSFAVEHAIGYFTSDRFIEFFHFVHLLAVIMCRISYVYKQRVDFFYFSL